MKKFALVAVLTSSIFLLNSVMLPVWAMPWSHKKSAESTDSRSSSRHESEQQRVEMNQEFLVRALSNGGRNTESSLIAQANGTKGPIGERGSDGPDGDQGNGPAANDSKFTQLIYVCFSLAILSLSIALPITLAAVARKNQRDNQKESSMKMQAFANVLRVQQIQSSKPIAVPNYDGFIGVRGKSGD